MNTSHDSLKRLILKNQDRDNSWLYEKKIGDVWEDCLGKKWKKIGDTTKVSIDERKIGAAVPFLCPNCGKGIAQIDEFFVMSENHCFDCHIEIEHAQLVENIK